MTDIHSYVSAFALSFGAEREVNGAPDPIDIPDAGRAELASLFGSLGYSRGAEIGVEQGEFAEVLLASNPNLNPLYLVDAWSTYRDYRDHVDRAKLERFYETTRTRLYQCMDRVTYLRKFSLVAVSEILYDQLDFVYIDANHHFDYVMPDIIEWSKRVRPGGIVAGHDYVKQSRVHVIEAVEVYTQVHKIWPWYTVSGDAKHGEPPSFFWVKP